MMHEARDARKRLGSMLGEVPGSQPPWAVLFTPKDSCQRVRRAVKEGLVQMAGNTRSRLLVTRHGGTAWQRACEGAGGPPKVGGPIGAPEHVGAVRAQAHVQQLADVLLEPLPGHVHVPGGEARVPRAKLCADTPVSLAPHHCCTGGRKRLHCSPSSWETACVCTLIGQNVIALPDVTNVPQSQCAAKGLCMQPAVMMTPLSSFPQAFAPSGPCPLYPQTCMTC